MWVNSQFPADLVTFTEKILNGKHNFLGSVFPLSCRPNASGIPQKDKCFCCWLWTCLCFLGVLMPSWIFKKHYKRQFFLDISLFGKKIGYETLWIFYLLAISSKRFSWWKKKFRGKIMKIYHEIVSLGKLLFSYNHAYNILRKL